jgi:Cd2+/Zn2+-exporting ATPase
VTRARLDLELLLPEVEDLADECVRRLIGLLENRPGVQDVHVIGPDEAAPTSAQLCLHYDPDLISLARVTELATAAGAELTGRFGHGLFALHAVDGEDAARRIERALTGEPGVLGASVSLPAQRVRVEWDRGEISESRVLEALQALGYAASVPPREPIDETAGWYRRNKELAWSLLAGTLLLAAWAGEHWAGLPRPPAVALYAAAYLFGGWDLVRHWLGAARKGRVTFDIDLLMLLAAAGAAVLGAWAEGAFLLFLFSLAHALEHYALGRARRAIRALAELAPALARVRRDGREIEVPVEQVAVGELVLIRPGERMPIDGTVGSGRSAVNQAPITGESVPVEKQPGDEVFAGTVNGDGALEVATSRVAGDRTLDRVVKLVEEAQTQKAPTQQLTERFERVFVPAVLIADVLLIVVPPLFGLWPWATAFYRGMALLVAASPCALALGTPSAVLAGIAQAARHGVLVKGGAHLENLGTLRAMAFDKTGTLTRGVPEVQDVIPFDGTSPDELLRVAAAVERRSQHPLAEAVVRRAEAEGLGLPEAGELQSITGRGIRAALNGESVEVGNLRLWDEKGVEVPPALSREVMELQAGGRSTMLVRYGSRWLGALGVADQPREGVARVLDRLRALGLKPLVMLTGDNRGVGQAIARQVGADEVRAELLPEAKVTAVRELLATHGRVAMVGDGVNDAPALAHATVGIAMGGAGTAAALETADVALMGDDLAKLPFAVGLSRRARAVIRQNLYLSLGVIALLILATTTGVFGIGPAVVVHEGSTLVVVANALRLLAYDDG